MLGETDFFDEFSGSQFDSVATVLLATYLVILTIMMLNLLVAVLSTAHARVDQNADQEYKVGRLIGWLIARLVVLSVHRSNRWWVGRCKCGVLKTFCVPRTQKVNVQSKDGG